MDREDKTGRLFDRVPMNTRRRELGDDLPKTAKELSKFIADSGSAEATIVVTDKV